MAKCQRDIPKKVRYYCTNIRDDIPCCPTCNYTVGAIDNKWMRYCPRCGQRLDWRNVFLDEKEKEYLSALIKPFKKGVSCICKKRLNECTQYIVIVMLDDEDIVLPSFKKGTMYKNMEAGRYYALEELEL